MDPATLRPLFPIGVGVGTVFTRAPLPEVPEAAHLLGPRASPSRRRAFVLGRLAARHAFADLGLPGAQVGMAPSGAPTWPTGVVGSISHTGDLGAAVIGAARHYLALGLDVESTAREVSGPAARRICSPEELAWAGTEAPGPRLLQLFSAKEAIFKALHPLGGIYLGFHDAELRWDMSQQRFLGILRRDAAPGFPAGSTLWVATRLVDGFVLAGVALAREDAVWT